MSEIRSALVIGAGTMGAGIAEVLAKAEIAVRLFDVNEDAVKAGVARIEKSLGKGVAKGKVTEEAKAAALGRITPVTGYEGAEEVGLVVEAAPESMALKKQIFGAVDGIAKDAILGSNTSSLSLTEIAATVADPSRVIGLHFFNPPPIMPLLEIVRAEQTSKDVVERARALAKRIGKQEIVVRDVAGFATSRLGIILGMEAIRMLEMGVGSAADIDGAMELGYKHPMGPLKLTDLVGLDVRLAIAEHLTKELGPQFTPPPLLRQLVRANKLGKKTGEGFYRWTDEGPVPVDRG